MTTLRTSEGAGTPGLKNGGGPVGRLAASASWLPGTVSVLVALAVWETTVRSGAVNPALLPAPSEVLITLAGLLRAGDVFGPLRQTLQLMIAGYFIACVLGISLGLLMGSSEAGYRLFEPLVELVRPIPKPALIPPLFLFLGIGVETMLFLVVLAAFFPILINTVQGVRGIDPVLLNTARTLRLRRSAVVFKVVLPAALPMIATGMRVSLAIALTLVIVAEMLAGEDGVGFLILDMQRAFRIPQMYAWLIVLAAVGVALNALFEWGERRFLPWRGQQ